MAKDLDPKTRAVALRLFNENLGLVASVVRMVRARQPLTTAAIDDDDLRSAGMLALWQAACVDREHENFPAYAFSRIRWAIADEILAATKVKNRHRNKRRVVMVPLSDLRRDTPDGDYEDARHLADRSAPNPEHEAIKSQERAELHRLIPVLPPNHEIVVRDRIQGVLHSVTAKRVGVSSGRVTQLLTAAIAKLRSRVPQ